MAIISVMYTMCSSFDVQSSARNKVIRSMVRLRERNEVKIEQRHNHAVRVSIPVSDFDLGLVRWRGPSLKHVVL